MGKNKGGSSKPAETAPAEKQKKKGGGWKAQLEEEEKKAKEEEERKIAIKNKIKFVRVRHILNEDAEVIKEVAEKIK